MRVIHTLAPKRAKRDIARNFGQAIAGKEDARDEAEGLRADTEVGVHCECGEADVHAV